MGITTVTAARILKGQLEGDHGEETYIEWDKFPSVALSKVKMVMSQTLHTEKNYWRFPSFKKHSHFMQAWFRFQV